MSDNQKTTNYLQVKAQLVINLLTNEAFREKLKKAQKSIINQKVEDDSAIRNILINNGYSPDLASEFVVKKDAKYEVKLDIEVLIESRITEVMPDDVEMMTLGGFNLNW